MSWTEQMRADLRTLRAVGLSFAVVLLAGGLSRLSERPDSPTYRHRRSGSMAAC